MLIRLLQLIRDISAIGNRDFVIKRHYLILGLVPDSAVFYFNYSKNHTPCGRHFHLIHIMKSVIRGSLDTVCLSSPTAQVAVTANNYATHFG